MIMWKEREEKEFEEFEELLDEFVKLKAEANEIKRDRVIAEFIVQPRGVSVIINKSSSSRCKKSKHSELVRGSLMVLLLGSHNLSRRLTQQRANCKDRNLLHLPLRDNHALNLHMTFKSRLRHSRRGSTDNDRCVLSRDTRNTRSRNRVQCVHYVRILWDYLERIPTGIIQFPLNLCLSRENGITPIGIHSEHFHNMCPVLITNSKYTHGTREHNLYATRTPTDTD